MLDVHMLAGFGTWIDIASYAVIGPQRRADEAAASDLHRITIQQRNAA
ncbi:MAG: hypothetical protein ACRECW_15775 [Phyllobacterium sp.]